MNGCEPSLLSAYLDGELDRAATERVAAHLKECAVCAAELASLRELSRSLAGVRVPELSADELDRIHQALDESVDAPVWRLGGMIGVIAASILVVSATWLVTLPARSPVRTMTQETVASTAQLADWEQVAVTLRVEPPQVGEDRVYLADAHLDEWMLEGLNRSAQR